MSQERTSVSFLPQIEMSSGIWAADGSFQIAGILDEAKADGFRSYTCYLVAFGDERVRCLVKCRQGLFGVEFAPLTRLPSLPRLQLRV